MRAARGTSSVVQRSVVLAAGSLTALAAGLATSKSFAMAMGPDGLGIFGVARGLAWFLGIVGGGVLGSVLIREGAAAVGQADSVTFYRIKNTCYRLGVTSLVVGLIVGVAREPISSWLFDSPTLGWLVGVCAVTGCLIVAAGIETGALAALGDHRHLARTTTLAAITAAAAAIGAVTWLGVGAIGVAILVHPIATWLLARRRLAPPRLVHPRVRSMGSLVGWAALPLTVSALLGGAVEFILPLVLVNLTDTATVGLFRAVYALAIGSLGFVGTVLAQEYYPRLSGLSRDDSLSLVVNRQLRLAAAFAALFAVAVGLFADQVLVMFFSGEFSVASPVLLVLLVTNTVRLPSWCLSYAVMARCPPAAYLGLEAGGAALTLGLSAWGLWVDGLHGLVLGLGGAYLGYFVCAWAVLTTATNYRMDLGTRWTMFLVAAGLVIAGFLPWR